jgi:two-component system, NarL family, nitrate/nitrite response regulator NarL
VSALREVLPQSSHGRLASALDRSPSHRLNRHAVPPLRVALVIEIALYREGLTRVLAPDPRFEVVASQPDVASALPIMAHTRPHMILLDAGGPLRESVRALTIAAPGVRVVALGVPEVEPEVLACAEAQVAAIVTADTSLELLVATLERVARDETLHSPRVAAMLLRRVGTLGAFEHGGDPRDSPLTMREHEILTLINDGLSNKEIARRLCIELPTVKNHVHNLLEKLQVRRRGEAAAWLRAQHAGGAPTRRAV